MHLNILKSSFLTAALLALAPANALAHHPMGGTTPTTFVTGLLSGFGHPIIGYDHLAAVLAIGALAAIAGRGFGVVIAYLAAMIGGVILHLLSASLPAAELLVGLSTALLGVLVALRFQVSRIALAVLFAAVGVIHGYALGEAIVGAESTPVGAYLLGLFAIQAVIAGGAFAMTRSLADADVRRKTLLRIAGGVVTIVGGITAASAAGFFG